VIAGCTQFKVITARGEEIGASLIASDEKLDVAVLKLSSPYRPKDFPSPPRIAPSGKVKSGEKVFTVGHPLGGLLSSEAKYNDGTVSAMSGMGDDQRVMQISVPIQPGNSGGPLANARGEIVGLIVATVNGSALLRETNILAQNINFAIKSDPILAFLDGKGLSAHQGTTTSDPVEHVKAYAVKIVSTP
jgi:S1-C subfamily serine protease